MNEILEKREKVYNIGQVISHLLQESPEERAEVISMYLTLENEHKVLIAIFRKLVRKLSLMKVIPRFKINIERERFPIVSVTPLEESDAFLLAGLLPRSENTKVSFFHRFLYQEDDAFILRAALIDVVDRLKEVDLLDKSFDLKFNEEKYKYALKQYDEGNKKFYTSGNSEEMP